MFMPVLQNSGSSSKLRVRGVVPNGTLFPIEPWSKVVPYEGNRVPFGTQAKAFVITPVHYVRYEGPSEEEGHSLRLCLRPEAEWTITFRNPWRPGDSSSGKTQGREMKVHIGMGNETIKNAI